MTPQNQLGPYRIVGQIGAGGMGVVFRAVHEGTGAPVAIKTVRAAGRRHLSAIRREIRALQALRHPGVVQIVDQGLSSALPWYAMTLLEGCTLRDLCRELHGAPGATPDPTDDVTTRSPDDVAWDLTAQAAPRGDLERTRVTPIAPPAHRLNDALRVIVQLCEPLAHVHAHGLVHADLKPSNVFLTSAGPVLVDFGLAARSGRDGRAVLDDTVGALGTPLYMAPEQVRGDRVDARTDLYSLGCILYQLLTGRPPFVGDPSALARQHVFERPRHPSQHVSDLPQGLGDLVLRLLAKRPSERVGHIAEVAATLSQVLGDTAPFQISDAVLYEPDLAGRDDVRDGLEARLDAARAGRGAFVVLAGESGIGKTQIAAEIAHRAGHRGMAVIVGECGSVAVESAGGHVNGAPLHPLRPLLQAVLDRCVEGGPETAARLLGDGGPVLARFEPGFAAVSGASDLPSTELPAEDSLDRLAAIVQGAIGAFVAERPTLLLLDDLHRADDLTLRVLSALPEGFCKGRGLVLLATARVEEAGQRLATLFARRDCESIPLASIPVAAVSRMVADILAMPEAPADLTRYLAEHSRGNPFFVTQYLRVAVSEKVIRYAGGRWEVPALSNLLALPIPDTVQALVGRRLAALSERTAFVARAAAVLGRRIDTELLAAVTGLDEAAGDAAISEAFENRVLEPDDGGSLRFAHDSLRESAYRQLDALARSDLHRRAARAIEAHHGAQADFGQRSAELYHHWERAGDAECSLRYVALAGEHALRTSAYDDAVRLLGEAVRRSVDASPLHRARCERQVGEACLGLGDHARSREHLQRAAALLRVPFPQSRAGLVMGLLGGVIRQVARRRRRSALPQVAQSRIEALTEGARIYDLLQIACRTTGDAPVILYAALRSLDLAELAGLPSPMATGYALARVIVAPTPLRGSGATYRALAEKAFEAAGRDPTLHTWMLQMDAVHNMGLGEWKSTLASSRECMAIAERIGFRRRWEESALCAAPALVMTGAFQEGRELYRALHASALGRGRYEIWALVGLAEIALRLGDAAGARAEAERLRVHLEPSRGALDPNDRLMIGACLGLIALHTGADAAGHADEALALLAKVPPMVLEAANVSAWVAETHVGLLERAPGDRQRRARARQACAKATAFSRAFPFMTPSAAFWSGRERAAAKSTKAALALLERSQDAAATLDMPLHEARACRAIAVLRPEGPLAEAARQRADVLEARLGVSS